MSKNWSRHIPALIERDGQTCHYCCRSIETNVSDTASNRLTVDHMEPRAKGGKSNIDNLILACRKCNVSKKATHYQLIAFKKVTDSMLYFLMDGDDDR